MKRILLITAVLFGTVAYGQQEFQTSQYLNNIYIINPAASGLNDYIDVNLGYRDQWSGIDGAPETYYISANSMLGKGSAGSNEMFSLRIADPSVTTANGLPLNADNTVASAGRTRHAVGGAIVIDKAGHLQKSFGSASYALHLPMSDKVNLSFGVKLGLSRLSFDQSKMVLAQSNDPKAGEVIGNTNKSTVFDGTAGLFLYSNKFFVGYSVAQLFQNDYAFNENVSDGKLDMHHYLIGGVNFQLSERVGFTPSTLVKMSGSAMAVDLNAKFDWDRKFWGGFSVRPGDAVVLMAGLNINQMVNFGYSYDITTSALNSVSNGSHEIVLNLMLSK